MPSTMSMVSATLVLQRTTNLSAMICLQIIPGSGWGLFMKALSLALLCVGLSGCIADEVGGVYMLTEVVDDLPSAKNHGKEVFFQAGDTWRAWSSEAWLDIEPKEGKSGRNGIVIMTAQPNHTKGRRSATVTIASGGKQQQLTVWQRNDYALFDPKEYVVDAEGGKVQMTFSSNVSKDSLLIMYYPQEWFAFVEDSSKKTRVADWDGKVKTLLVQPNTEEMEREVFFLLMLSGARRIDYQVLDTAWVRQPGLP